MRNKYCSTTLIMLLFLTGCIPTQSIMVQTQAVVQPKISATPTSTPISTPTPALATAAPQELPAVGRVPPRLDLQAQSAVLLDATTGEVLYAKNAHQQMYPASTTKIMTAILALEYFKADEIIEVGDEANLAWTSERKDAQKASLNYGEELTMKELLYGLMLASGSDAAFTIAVNVARRESMEILLTNDQAVTNFVALMNKQSTAIGAVETNFSNPDGFQNSNHYSTAYDLALIARYGMEKLQFREIVAATTYSMARVVSPDEGSYSRTWENTNRLIQPQDEQFYAPANGIKTGTTPEAGHCLISSAMVGDNLVIAVVLNSTQVNVWSDSVTLLKYAMDNPH